MPTSYSVLVVDDDPRTLQSAISSLAGEGLRVRAANSGEVALASIQARPPQLILLDVRMPGIDGFEVYRRVKTCERTRSIPIIFLSAAHAREEHAQALKLGAADFIVKPLRRRELVARVRAHLEPAPLRTDLEAQMAQATAKLRTAMEQLQVEVAERTRTEQALRESEELTRLAMQAGRTYAFEWNPQTGDLRRSYNCAGLLRVSGDATREPWDDCIKRVHPDDRPALLHRISGLTPGSDLYEGEYRVIGLDGEIVHLHSTIRALFDGKGRPTRYVGIAADISLARRAEAALYESEDRFSSMADAAPMMICASGPDKQATFFNRAWLAFTGRSLEQELGYGWLEGVHPDDRQRTVAAYSSSFESRRKCHLEYRLRRADGEYRSIVCSGVPRLASSGAFGGYIATCVDITDLKRAQEEAFERQRLEGLRVLTGGIAHDFNNLLAGIVLDADAAEMSLAGGVPPEDEIHRIKTIAIRAADIVRELMIYAGQEESRLHPVNVSAVVEDMLALLKASVSKNVALISDLEKDLPPLLGNATQIRQLVMNLVINASEAIGPRDGTIRVVTSRESNRSGGDYIRLEVSDTGCGMTEEAKARIFEPFFTTKFTGHGLGLAVVQGIAHSHGGVINVKSAPGEGSIFEILLPCSATGIEETPAGRDASRIDTPPGSCRTVLVVENEESLRLSLSNGLRRRGFAVWAAADGHTAVDLFRTRAGEIDIVVLDLTLPGLSGLEVLREFRLYKPEVKVVLTSANNHQVGSIAAEGEAQLRFLRKPYQLGELVRSICQSAASGSSAESKVPCGHAVRSTPA